MFTVFSLGDLDEEEESVIPEDVSHYESQHETQPTQETSSFAEEQYQEEAEMSQDPETTVEDSALSNMVRFYDLSWF